MQRIRHRVSAAAVCSILRKKTRRVATVIPLVLRLVAERDNAVGAS